MLMFLHPKPTILKSCVAKSVIIITITSYIRFLEYSQVSQILPAIVFELVILRSYGKTLKILNLSNKQSGTEGWIQLLLTLTNYLIKKDKSVYLK